MIVGLVEDRPQLATFLKEGLERSGNTITLYESAREAESAILEARFHNQPSPVALLIVDLDAGDQCTAMLRRIRQFVPPTDLTLVALSGSDLIERNLLSQDHVCLLKKPLTPGTIDKAIKEEVAARSLLSEP